MHFDIFIIYLNLKTLKPIYCIVFYNKVLGTKALSKKKKIPKYNTLNDKVKNLDAFRSLAYLTNIKKNRFQNK